MLSGSPRIRIQYVIATLDRAGAEGQLAALATRLDRDRFDPHVVCLTRGGPLESVLQASGVPCLIFGKRHKLDFSVLPRLYRQIRTFRPHIVHTWLFTSNAWGRLAGILARAPVLIASERAVDLWKTWPYRWTDRLLASWTDRIVGNSQAVCDFALAETGLPDDRVLLIPNGVDLARFRVRQHTETPEVVFASVGRLSHEKRFDLVLRALSQLRSAGIAARLRIAGQGPLESDLRQLAESLGVSSRVEFCGLVANVADVLSSSDALVLASDMEGFPNVVLEAMASGLPVVATAVGGCKELVVPGQTGRLVSAGDAAALAEAMSGLARSWESRRDFGAAGRQRVDSLYSMPRMVQRYEQLYEELAGALAR